MWIRVESYEVSSPNCSTPSTVLNFFGGRQEPQNNDNAEHGAKNVLFSLGRKAGDVTFPSDKSVSRQHFTVRCVKEPRNDAERRACQANPFQMCLVLENVGKAGTFIAESSSPSRDDGDDDVGENQQKAAGDDDDEEETDDEGTGGMISQASQRVPQQLAALGDGTAVPEMELPPSMKDFWKKEKEQQQPQIVRVDVGQSRVLDVTTKKLSIMMQAGLNGSTLKVTWVPFSVVFSRVPTPIQTEWKNKKLHQIGALETAMITENTTHLITPEASGSAKPLAACCRGIPIVTPDYLQVLMDHKSSKDPLPSPEQYRAPFTQDGSMNVLRTKAADPKLMAGYVVFTLEETELDPVIRFSGGRLVPLYEESNEKARMEKVEGSLEALADKNPVFLVLSSRKRLFSKLTAKDGIFSFTQQAWAKAVSRQEPKLVDTKGNAIPLPSTTSNGSRRTPPSGAPQIPPAGGTSDSSSDTEDEAPAPSKERDANKLQTQEELSTATRTSAKSTNSGIIATGSRKRPGDDSNSSSQVDSCSMTEVPFPTHQKRQRREIPYVEQAPETVHQEASPVPEDEETGKKEADAQDDQENEDFPVEHDVSMEDDEDVSPQDPPKKPRRSNHATSSSTDASDSNIQQCLGKPDASGWYTIAPRDNAVRKAWRKKASKMNAEIMGEHLMPPAQSAQVVAIVSPTTTEGSSNTNGSRDALGRRPRRTNGPNFKSFRKNIVPRKVDACERIALKPVQARESEQQQRLQENQRELEAEQRRADELFREIGAGTSTTRRRRR